jgi:pyrrolidone-carboxylate peptidase
MGHIIYTFENFPFLAELQAFDSNVLVFHKLKQDIANLEELIDANPPDFILGIAASKRQTRFEPIAINQFNKNGVVLPGEPHRLELYVPPSIPPGFSVATIPTTTFCNWTMFRIQSLIIQKGLPTKFAFVHIKTKDMTKLNDLLASFVEQ